MHDEGETVAHEWIVPRVALERHARGEMQLMFPTMKTLELLATFGRVATHSTTRTRRVRCRRCRRDSRPAATARSSSCPGDYAYAEVGKLDPDGKGTAAYEILPGVPVRIAPRIVPSHRAESRRDDGTRARTRICSAMPNRGSR